MSFNDVILGQITADLSLTEADPILLKSDKFPTYHLANVVDDHLMEISHVLRGVEWQTSTPKHIMLYEAFGWDAPQFAHLPLITNGDNTKLSKRQNDINIGYLKRQGYAPEALVSYMGRIGGGFGKQGEDEIMTLDQLADNFSLEQVNNHPCKLDPTKMIAYNRLAIKYKLNTDSQHLISQLRSALSEKFGEEFSKTQSDEVLLEHLTWGQDRVNFIKELVDEYGYVFACPNFDWNVKKYTDALGDLGEY